MKVHKFSLTLAILAVIVASCSSGGGTDTSFDELEEVLARRDEICRVKESRIDSLKHLLHQELSDVQSLQILNSIYDEYHTYSFDSAMVCVDRAERLAKQCGESGQVALSKIHRSILLSTAGYFSESIQNLNSVEHRLLQEDSSLRIPYYTACEWAYSMWAEYSDDNVYAPGYYAKEMLYQDSLIASYPDGSSYNFYWRAERLYRDNRFAEAEQMYHKALENTPINVRLCAMATFGLALVSQKQGNESQYAHYLMQAAISDQLCPLKENLALQELAFYIISANEGEAERANRYLNISTEDALFYNNRLRLLEIAEKTPLIVQAYHDQIRHKNTRLRWSLFAISILSICLIAAIALIYRQIRLLRRRQRIQEEMNRQLQELNRQLSATNVSREQYVSLFMDLCAAYIEKLDKYQELVRRKVKAHQTDDLLRLANVTRLTDADAKEFFFNFDTAFLNVYPNFVEAFNGLLLPGEQIMPKRGEILNTDLRIFALIRLGIRDSSKIATLLFYSPQTIYNRRSAVKSRAANRDTFEAQVQSLCATI